MNDTRETAAPDGYLEAARQDGRVLVAVHGLGSMRIALTLADFAEAELKRGYARFAIDLADCAGMDSTFMGTLVGLAAHLREEGGWICLLHVSDANRRLLEMLGVAGLVPEADCPPLEDLETERLLPEMDLERRLSLIRAAHENLIAIDERNRDRFGAFLAALDEEMGSDEAQ